MTATLTQISAELERVARWLRSDDAQVALLHVQPPQTGGGQSSSRSGEISRPTELAVLRNLDSADPVERDQRRALQLIASVKDGSVELVDVLVRLGTLVRLDADDPCRSPGCAAKANARRGLCWKHYRAELAG